MKSDFLVEKLIAVAQALMEGRGTGKTMAITNMARLTGGVVIARTQDEANYIKNSFNTNAVSSSCKLQGLEGPFFLDHHAAEALLYEAADEIRELQKANRSLETKLRKMKE